MTVVIPGPLLHEGKAKRVHATDHPDLLAVDFKDDATAFNAEKRASLAGKGLMNCRISALVFEYLKDRGVPTHYLGVQNGHWMVVRSVKIIPIEVVVRNIAAGSLCRQMPIAPATPLEPPLLDLYYKDDRLGDPLLTEARLERLQLLAPGQRQQLEALAMQVNRNCGPCSDRWIWNWWISRSNSALPVTTAWWWPMRSALTLAASGTGV